MSQRETEGLQHLGSQGTQYPTDYAPEMLESFVNNYQENLWISPFLKIISPPPDTSL